MLKKNPLEESRASRLRQFGTLVLIGLATLFAVGLRSRSNPADAQEPDAPKARRTIDARVEAEANREEAPQPPKAFPLTYVPDDAVAVFGVRPKALLAKPTLEPLAKAILQAKHLTKPMGIPLDQIEEVVWSFTGKVLPGGPVPRLVAGMVRTSEKLNLERLKQQITPESTTGFYGGQLYLKQRNGEGFAFWLADEYTLIASSTEAGLKRAIDARNTSVNREKRMPAWNAVSKKIAAEYVNVRQLRNELGMGDGRIGGHGAFGPPMGGGGMPMTPQRNFQQTFGLNPMFAPLWNDVDTVVGSLGFDKGMEADVVFHASDAQDTKADAGLEDLGAGEFPPKAAAKVEDTLNAMMVLGRNMVEQNQQMIGQLPQRKQQMVGLLLKLGQEVLKTLKIERKDADVSVHVQLPKETVSLLVALLVPNVTAAHNAAQRVQSLNNLKNIGLAMHNFHDTYQHFPAASHKGKGDLLQGGKERRGGKYPHSWRVAILPFIEQSELYNQYHFDEPWDSEHNKKLLSKMPSVYRSPKDKPDSTNTSYFALVGKNTLMGDGEDTTRLQDVLDGNSNTLMIVEARRDTPWTKPEDIPYAGRSKPLPKLGGWFEGGFNAVFGDGAARFLSEPIDKTTLQDLIERNDGHPVQVPGRDRPRTQRGSANRPIPLPSGEGDSGGEGLAVCPAE